MERIEGNCFDSEQLIQFIPTLLLQLDESVMGCGKVDPIIVTGRRAISGAHYDANFLVVN